MTTASLSLFATRRPCSSDLVPSRVWVVVFSLHMYVSGISTVCYSLERLYQSIHPSMPGHMGSYHAVHVHVQYSLVHVVYPLHLPNAAACIYRYKGASPPPCSHFLVELMKRSHSLSPWRKKAHVFFPIELPIIHRRFFSRLLVHTVQESVPRFRMRALYPLGKINVEVRIASYGIVLYCTTETCSGYFKVADLI
jgi:hypothetical protein